MAIVALTVRADCTTHAHTTARAREHKIVMDEPAVLGGTDRGPTPIETMLGSFLGCTNVILNRIAKKRNVEIHALSLEAKAHLDRRGVTLEKELAVPLPEIRLTINLTTSANDAQLEEVRADLGDSAPCRR